MGIELASVIIFGHRSVRTSQPRGIDAEQYHTALPSSKRSELASDPVTRQILRRTIATRWGADKTFRMGKIAKPRSSKVGPVGKGNRYEDSRMDVPLDQKIITFGPIILFAKYVTPRISQHQQ
ncbi:hypothetical protein BC936DRAFT_149073 [Jimgerdemannia flammicorona]|uniref:Uncharacterized protein n=2 Tax=Jimgerdemannia flammicorona TaxID=994334 RepID=A0A433D1M3_9FUNG|nr:hypothetical protein BC936DRAFT_149073 [Jimgerdemannia flammicorona]RUS27710.1 hypothetical protein BC938DRAFT_482851 [Jimgerdemannia flammicorona]